MDAPYFKNKVPIPVFGTHRAKVEWALQTARAMQEHSVSSNEFVYTFGIPRISGIIHQLRELGWVIENLAPKGKTAKYKLIRTPGEWDALSDNRIKIGKI
tara:strand:+ start:519 stop:818 length:300 start_codon:yes stop_codon:yes gene_type:complete